MSPRVFDFEKEKRRMLIFSGWPPRIFISLFGWVMSGWGFLCLACVVQSRQNFNYPSSKLIIRLLLFLGGKKKSLFFHEWIVLLCLCSGNNIKLSCLYFSLLCDVLQLVKPSLSSDVSIHRSFTERPHGAEHQQKLCVPTFGKWVGEATLRRRTANINLS